MNLMNAIDFVVRTRTGDVQRGSVGGENDNSVLQTGAGNDISLNLSKSDLRAYDRVEDDLLITLADGRVIVLQGYFSDGANMGEANRLFLSSDGTLSEVTLVSGDGGALFAQYGPSETWAKWSPSDELIFVGDPQVTAPDMVGGYQDNEEVSMFGAGLLGATTLGGAGLAAAGVGTAAVIAGSGGGGNGGSGGGGGGGTIWVPPTVDDPDENYQYSGGDDPSIIVSGTANPGSTVEVVIGNETVTGTAGEDRTWDVTFEGDSFPDDGFYVDIDVTVTDPNGTVTDLDGPTFEIDTTPPEVEILEGTVGTGDLFNSDGHADGVTVSGTAEAGSTLTITVEGSEETITVSDEGTWEFTYDATVLPGGEYVTAVAIKVVDNFGNTTTITDEIQIDTVNEVTLTNAPLTGDDVIAETEYDAGVTLTGTSQAGASIDVTIEGVTKTVTTSDSGEWSVTFTSTDLAPGTYTTTAQIVSTDPAGNVSTATHTFSVDTETALTINTSIVETDGVINAAEASDGAVLTGTAEAGATVSITVGSSTLTATADGDGAWSVNIPASEIPSGETTLDVTATSTDAAGNSSTTSGSITIDTTTSVSVDTSAAGSDGTVNAVEHNGMITVTGMGEAGATIDMEVNGYTAQTTVDASGAWSVTFAASVLDTGETSNTVNVTSTDMAGNTATAAGTIDIDTLTDVSLETATVEGDGTVNATERMDGVVLTGSGEPGAAVVVSVAGTTLNATVASNGNWFVTLPAADVPEGELSLPVTATATDLAGNTATATGSIDIDTITNVAVQTATVEGDGVVNAAEHSDGVVLTGQAEPGSTVSVTMGSVTRTANVAGDGSWSANFAASDIPTGERTLNVTATATDAAGNVANASGTVDVDTFVRNFGITSTPGGADGVINAEEAAQGLTLTGTTEPGGTVTLSLGGQTVQATVATDGSWTASFSAGQLPAGEQTLTLTAVATDPAGNTDTLTQDVRIDTDAGILTISPAPVEGDDLVNMVEASDGVVLTGTSNPYQMVDVTMNGVTHTVQTDGAGNWTAPFAANEIAPGTYTADITATITDSAGNTLTRTDSVDVDTEVLNFAASGTPVEGDNVINASEASNGFTLTGTTEPGGSVTVSFEGASRAAQVDGSGNWTVSFSAGEIPAGEMASGAMIDTVDRAGNIASTSVSFAIDTEVNALSMSADPVTADNVVNAQEALAGITLTGEVEAGSSVTVSINGVQHSATVSGSSWSVDIPPSSMPQGTMDAPVMISATDAAGNTRSVTETIAFDTDTPGAPNAESYTRDHNGLRGVSLEMSDHDVEIGHVVSDLQVDGVSFADVDIPVLNETSYAFTQNVPDGSHLVITQTDAAGNQSGTYLVVDDTTTSDVAFTDNLANTLGSFQIETIDLQFAEDSALTITEAQIEALSDTTNTVMVQGGGDDSVTITGAQAAGSQVQDGTTYNVFTLGDATLLIEDDITSIHGVI